MICLNRFIFKSVHFFCLTEVLETSSMSLGVSYVETRLLDLMPLLVNVFTLIK